MTYSRHFVTDLQLTTCFRYLRFPERWEEASECFDSQLTTLEITRKCLEFICKVCSLFYFFLPVEQTPISSRETNLYGVSRIIWLPDLLALSFIYSFEIELNSHCCRYSSLRSLVHRLGRWIYYLMSCVRRQTSYCFPRTRSLGKRSLLAKRSEVVRVESCRLWSLW